MPERYSRRSFLSGVLATGTFTAATIYLMPGARTPREIELRLVSGVDPTGARDLLISLWNDTNPRSPLRVDTVAAGSGDERQIMLDRAQGGEVDLLNLDIIDVPEFAAKELIIPIPVSNARQATTPLHQISRVPGDDGSYWAVPFNTDVGMLFSRTDDDTPPEAPRLPELLRAIPDGTQQFVGQLRPSVSAYYEAFVVNVLEHAAAERPGVLKPVDAPGVGSVADRISQDLDLWNSALTPLREAIVAGRVLPSGDETDSRDRFAAPQSPHRYMRNWPVKYRELQQQLNPDVRAGRVRVDPLTVGVLGGQSLAVVASSPYAERAMEFITYATSEPAQKILATHGLAPTAIGAYSDANIEATVPHLDKVREAVEQALPRPAHPNYRGFSNVVKQHVELFLYDGQDLAPRFIEEMMTALQ
ncbi:extracellular solute-binding protein [Micromonospora sp. NBC_01813]|uniref:extracellular solute-binding protein n=1 Tax=Micromonospora sp. NBC_01813 TaxID=2975988 RepID=UPI002DDB222A|nr:extracellular solute-binding protein [Micromonospora sp. NBC_01813]WSA08526.1 extracellular solute-binding protein [Micromonospora sp. NBC_01813]